MTASVDSVVVGGGIVGVAVARALARAGDDVVVLEAERALGQHQSSRNSEVIHAGLYYPTDSLRARLCVTGRRALYEYCTRRSVPHRRVGKIVVATDPTHGSTLERIAAQAERNGVEDVRLCDAAQTRRIEPEVRARASLHSPVSGIVDSHALLSRLWGEAQDAGAQLALATALRHATPTHDGFALHTDELDVRCRRLVIAAGFDSPTVAARIEGYPTEAIPPRHLVKGSYFRIDARPFRGLVYPVPDTASLGIHVTVDLHGGVRFGPDQQWVDDVDYRVDPSRASAFATAIARYWPDLDPAALRPDYAGIRAKLHAPDAPGPDFVVHDATVHGHAGLVVLLGIDSPGLTACLPLAALVADRLGVAATS